VRNIGYTYSIDDESKRHCDDVSDDDEETDSDYDSSEEELMHIREWVIQKYIANPLKLNGGNKIDRRNDMLYQITIIPLI